MTLIDQMEEAMDDVQENLAKFEGKGNKSAGIRARVKLAKMMVLAKNARAEILLRLKG